MAYKKRTPEQLAETYKHSEMGNTRGRPPIEIDWSVFEALCHVQCTHDEIAATLKIAKPALYERACEHYKEMDFATVYKRFCSTGQISLRRHQFRQAENNVAMSIWLGKQHLGQHEPYPPKEEAQDNIAADKLAAALDRAAQALAKSRASE
jgi:hypothetical protein